MEYLYFSSFLNHLSELECCWITFASIYTTLTVYSRRTTRDVLSLYNIVSVLLAFRSLGDAILFPVKFFVSSEREKRLIKKSWTRL
jgi:hypothetical protein